MRFWLSYQELHPLFYEGQTLSRGCNSVKQVDSTAQLQALCWNRSHTQVKHRLSRAKQTFHSALSPKKHVCSQCIDSSPTSLRTDCVRSYWGPRQNCDSTAKEPAGRVTASRSNCARCLRAQAVIPHSLVKLNRAPEVTEGTDVLLVNLMTQLSCVLDDLGA